MKNIIKRLLPFCCLLSFVGYAQETNIIFNKTYGGNDTLNILAQAVVPVDSGYLVFGNYATNTIEAGLGMTILDKKGDFLSFKSIEKSPTFINLGISSGNQILKESNSFLLLYIKEQDINIVKFNYSGDTLWHHSYNKTGFQSGIQAVKTPDTGYLIAGMEANVAGDTVRGYVLKVDSLGNFEWDRRYEKGNDARFFSIQPTPWDGGYILGGMGYSATKGYDMFVVKTDSLGDTLWTRSYGSNQNDCLAIITPVTTMASYQAGNPIEYIMTGCYQSNEVDILWGYVDDLYLAKLDSIGNPIWQRVYNTSPNNLSIQTMPIMLADGGFIATGVYFTPLYIARPIIIRFNYNNTIAWQREVYLDPLKNCYIKDMRPTSDGGYVLAGYQYTVPQTAWVMKIDSLGNTCSFVGCDSTVYVGVGETPILQGQGAAVFKLYPNPAQDYLVVENNSQEQNATFVLYDVVGRAVLQQPVPTQNNISIQHLPSGVYLYHFLNPQKQILAYGKISVLH